ncbi:flagellar biosynthetic protein FliQ [Bradyrhizobium diazoefficiens]|nr:flagellar biosynthetic protein FliQ [Bradyrhizobium diazoefficiens]MBR0965582.1 flagellar biosynthetic protein FliQ [Bradyrhizobium diazoefficiens]MBR0979274.1 flagellar biosynthetic protein FliQ [Bradyrhizobium diazoefficiens]MBR1008666.1 flagellar biosynthetic protein FliQ [Bradyrhizobium diazoefficiens]MBR1014785.1 flagellar biosynthetic protein FliQ [Bradyrhizobium diazoefficiens]MBR1052627.1 flagellar biosynthetic protein FliQ [Bradyrhizobium diazoefficiens]
MTGAEVIDAARDALMTVALISAPLMIIGTIVGVLVSLFQALTQIQEQTLIYVPKIIATFLTLLIALPFMSDQTHRQFLRMMTQIMASAN